MLKTDHCRETDDVKTTTTSARSMTTITDNKGTGGSQYVARCIRNVQQANKATAAQYEYRLTRFEKYVPPAYKEEEQQQERIQQQKTKG
jgi:Na+-translocating ferredoxin:NAD+ oxidoreductase RNF subunit RnfB